MDKMYTHVIIGASSQTFDWMLINTHRQEKTVSKILRVWSEIAKISCSDTKYVLATCKDSTVLSRLAEAFPECFRKGCDDEMDRFSWKRILRAACKYYSCLNKEGRPCNRYVTYHWCTFFYQARLDAEDHDLAGIPFLAWGRLSFEGKRRGERPPESIVHQLRAFEGKTLEEPMFIDFEGVRCVVGEIWFDYGGTIPGEKLPFHIDVDSDGPHELALIPADIIVFDC